jgi:hypothetical protein
LRTASRRGDRRGAGATLASSRARGPTIRAVASLLIALLLAAAVGLLGYVGLLALRRAGTTTAAVPLTLPELLPPPAPKRLPPDPGFDQQTFAASASREPAMGRRLRITLRGVPAELRTPAAGVASFQASSGSDFVWSPLATATGGNEVIELLTTVRGSGDVVVTLAAARPFARHGYLLRQQVAANGDGAELRVDLTLTTARVRLRLLDPDIASLPLRLVRRDDPQWLPMELGGGSIVVPRGGELTLLLGAGDYELRDPLAPSRAVALQVPGSSEVDVSAALATERGDRP